jgi:hypothetical protein
MVSLHLSKKWRNCRAKTESGAGISPDDALFFAARCFLSESCRLDFSQYRLKSKKTASLI